jgi:Zn-finger nucleic acid-binding protein
MTEDSQSYLCPKCNLPLTRVATSEGIFWMCTGCGGRAVTVELLRRTFTPESINPLWRHAISGQTAGPRPCPSCRRLMQEVALSETATVRVDVCRLCHFVWFDAHETETLAPRPIPARKPKIPAKLNPEPAAFGDPWGPGNWWGDIFQYLIDLRLH